MRSCRGGQCLHSAWNLRCERGGSGRPSTTIVQPPPPQVTERPLQPLPQQTIQETSRQLAESQLEFNPRLAQQAFELQKRFLQPTAELQFGVQRALVPQAAQSEFEIAQRFTPLYRAIYEQAFPEQTTGLQTLARQTQQRFLSPAGLTPEQQTFQDAYRQRAREQIQRNVREAANLGGTLFGGRRIEAETDALNRFEQAVLEADLARQIQARDQALREMIVAQQVIFPQVQQPGVPQGGVPGFQGVTPSVDALLQAIIAQSQGAIINPAVVGFGPSRRMQNAAILQGLSSGAGGFASEFGAALAAGGSCHVAEVLYGAEDIRTWLARRYVATHDSLFLRLYRTWSRVWARWLQQAPLLRPVVRPLWDRMWRAQLRTI